jgi:cell wall-associated NlpC family hydrolase
VPVPRPRTSLFRSLSVVGFVGLFIAVSAGSTAAAPGQPAPPPAPRTSAQALAQLRAFNEEFEKVTEQYNDARVLLKKRQVEARLAAGKARTAAAEYAAVDGQIRHVVSSAYRADPFAQFSSLLTSGSPQEFLEQIAALDAVAGRRATVLVHAGKVRAAATKAAAEAKTAVGAANRLLSDLTAKRSDLSRRAAESKRLFTRLSKQERAAFLAQQAAVAAQPADRGSRSTPRPPPVDQGPVVNVPASGRAGAAVATARRQLGKPYVWAAAGPSAFDCSGLTMYSWAAAGVALPHSSSMQMGVGRRVSRSQLQPGDLVFFYSPVHHVGLYVGGGRMIHAPTSNDVVKYAAIDTFPWAGATRPG